MHTCSTSRSTSPNLPETEMLNVDEFPVDMFPVNMFPVDECLLTLASALASVVSCSPDSEVPWLFVSGPALHLWSSPSTEVSPMSQPTSDFSITEYNFQEIRNKSL